ncbi:phage tail protein [Methylobacterium oryzae]
MTGENLKASLQYFRSNEIRKDRNVGNITQIGGNSGGAVNMELSYGSFDVWLEALFQSTWNANVLKNGVTKKTFTLEKLFENGATDQYHRYLGAQPNTLNLSLEANKEVVGSFDFVSMSKTKGTTAIASSTYTAATTTDVMNAADNVANLAITGVTSPRVTKMDISITNNLAPQSAIGSKYPIGVRSGRFQVTGTLEAYFDNAALYDLFVDNVATDMAFDIGGVSTQKYNFDLNKIKFIDGEVIAGGNDQDVMARMQFEAYFDGTSNSTMVLTRTP